MMPIAVMLLLAWAMGDILTLLGSDAYVANWVAGSISGAQLPLLIFIVACLVSFATGSSWGTFALLFPLALPAAVTVDASLALSVAAVLSGGSLVTMRLPFQKRRYLPPPARVLTRSTTSRRNCLMRF